MTVAELIRDLQALPQSLDVMTEGCDCHGDVARAVVDRGGVLLVRSDGDWLDDRICKTCGHAFKMHMSLVEKEPCWDPKAGAVCPCADFRESESP